MVTDDGDARLPLDPKPYVVRSYLGDYWGRAENRDPLVKGYYLFKPRKKYCAEERYYREDNRETDRAVLDSIIRRNGGWWPEARDEILTKFVRRSREPGNWQSLVKQIHDLLDEMDAEGGRINFSDYNVLSGMVSQLEVEE